MLSASEIIDALDKIGVDTGVLGQVIQVIDKLPGIADNVRIAFGSPNHAGIYAVTAVTDNRNYKTGVGVGALVLKADKAKLVWKQDISKISAANAANADFMAELTVNGVAVADQSSVHVLYSGFTSKWKPYSSTSTPPTEPGLLRHDRGGSGRRLCRVPRDENVPDHQVNTSCKRVCPFA